MTSRRSFWRSLLGRRFWIPAYLMLGAGLALPIDGGALRPLIPIFLGGILYFTCLKVDPHAVSGEMRRAGAVRRLGGLVVVKLVVIPLVVWSLARVLAPDWALALTLVAAMPAGLSSVALADLYRGNLALALMVVLATSVVCPISVPLLLEALSADGASFRPGPLAAQASYILVLLALPWIASRVTARRAPKWVADNQHTFGPLAIACLCGLVLAAASATRPAWVERGVDELSTALLLSCAVSLVFLLVGLIAKIRLRPRDAVAMTCNVVYVNHGLAVAFAAQFYPDDPRMLLPAVLIQIPVVAVITTVGKLVPVPNATTEIA